MSPPQSCAHPGCPALVRRGSRCPEHRLKRRTAHQRGYTGGEWRVVRELIIERDGGSCQECGRPGRQVAHVRPRRDGGDDEPENLRLLCDACHARETRREELWRERTDSKNSEAPPSKARPWRAANSRRAILAKNPVPRLNAKEAAR